MKRVLGSIMSFIIAVVLLVPIWYLLISGKDPYWISAPSIFVVSVIIVGNVGDWVFKVLEIRD